MSYSNPRIIVTGYVGYIPVGGVAWDYLQYVAGLARLGYDVFYHEDTAKWPYHPIEQDHTEDGAYSARYIQEFFQEFAPEMNNRWHYLHLREQSFGMTRKAFDEVAATADLFLNVSGASFVPDNLSSDCKKIFLDSDPGYNQIRMHQRIQKTGETPGFLRVHDQYFTYAENILDDDCLVPTLGVKWKPTRMPIVLDLWSDIAGANLESSWTTVLTWSAFRGELSYNGISYEGKDREFEKLIALPELVDSSFKIAIGGPEAPLQRLQDRGWETLDGPKVTGTPQQYKDFIADSRAEISIAKHVYVALRSGWFSCRSACYLAAGRPVVLQDTGFSKNLPTDLGIQPFNNLEEAVAAIESVEQNYEQHMIAAREIALEYFDAQKVLKRLVEEALA